MRPPRVSLAATTLLCIDQSLLRRPFALDKFQVPHDFHAPLSLQQQFRIQHAYPRMREYHEPHFHVDPSFFHLAPPLVLNGYFQSERYFSDIADILRRHFSLSAPLSEPARQIEEEIS